MQRTKLAALAASVMVLVACSGSDPRTIEDAGASRDTASDSAANDATASYSFTQAGALHVGKSTFQLSVRAGDAPARGLAERIRLTPLMVMPKMSHGNPVPIDAVRETATAGTYDVTLFFTMASLDASGNPAGQWKLGVAVDDGPETTFPVDVARPTSTATTHAMLKNEADTITAMGAPKLRSYVLFRDDVTADGRVTLFVATVQEGLRVWPPLTKGLELVSSSGAVQLVIDSFTVEGSADGAAWTPMACDATSRCAATFPGLAERLLVRLKVNGREYTTDGFAPKADGSNAYATFTIARPS